MVGELGREFVADEVVRALEVAEVDQDADLEEAEHGGVGETELVGIGRLAEDAVLVASVDFFQVADAFLFQEVVALLIAAEAEEESGDTSFCSLLRSMPAISRQLFNAPSTPDRVPRRRMARA